MFGLEAVIIAALVASMTATVAGSVVAGVQAEQAADFQEESFKRQADAAKKKGYREGERRRRLNRIAMRRMSEQIGKSGMEASSGTPLDVYITNDAQRELNALNAEVDGLYARDSLLGQADAAHSAGINNRVAVGFSGLANVGQIGISGAVALGANAAPGPNPGTNPTAPTAGD